MSRSDILATLQQIFRDVLDNDSLNLSDELTASDVDGWDSLAHISIIAAIEKRYGIRFTLGELDSFENVGQLIDMTILKANR